MNLEIDPEILQRSYNARINMTMRFLQISKNWDKRKRIFFWAKPREHQGFNVTMYKAMMWNAFDDVGLVEPAIPPVFEFIRDFE